MDYSFSSINRSDPVNVAAPAKQPLELDELKEYLNVVGSAENRLLLMLLKAATEEVEADLRMALYTRTMTQKLDHFPDGPIELRVVPVTSVTSITYLNESNVSTTVSSSLYTVDTQTRPPRINLGFSEIWPVSYEVDNAITVTFVAGYASQAAIPDGLKNLVRMKTAMLYEDRHGGFSHAAELHYNRTLVKFQWHGYS